MDLLRVGLRSKSESVGNKPRTIGAAAYRLLVVAAVLAAPLLQAGSPLKPIAKDSATIKPCTYVIPESVIQIDGQTNYAKVKPGDVLCFIAGVRPNVKLMNLEGTTANPITVRNTGGKVTITGTLFLTGGIGIVNSSNLHITGTGVSTQCGAEYSTEDQDCGIEITRTQKGIKLDTSKGTLGNIEIDHVSVHDITEHPANVRTRGISIHPGEKQLISDLYIHHNYIAGTSAEGIYLGTEPHARPYEVLGKLKNIEVSYNLVEDTQFDGIKVKVAIENVQVHNNVVRHTGLSHTPAHQGGIKLAMSTGDYYNNFVETEYEGIRMGRPLDNAETRYFNNVVVGGTKVGIEALEDNALVYNNTVVNSGRRGINAPGTHAQVYDNIIVGATGVPIDGLAQNVWNNFTGTVDSAKFINPTAEDYRLRPDSPVIDAGGKTIIFPYFDFQGVLRPQGDRVDIGAYEYSFMNGYFNLLR